MYYGQQSEPEERAALTGPKPPVDEELDQRFQTENQCRDWIWAVLFLAQLIGLLVCGALFQQNTQNTGPFNSNIFVLVGVTIVVSVAFTLLWFYLMKKYPQSIIIYAYLGSCIFTFLFAMAILFQGQNMVAGAIMFVCSIFMFLFYYFVKDRIPFSALVLETIVSAIDQYPATIYFALLALVLQAAWAVAWVFSTVAIYNHVYPSDRPMGNSSGIGLLFFAVLSLFWTVQVLSNVIHVTVAGTVASWYFYAVPPPNPTLAAFKRATTWSFGSICLGSLVVAIVQALRWLFSYLARKSENALVQCCVDCILGCLQALIRYVNVYAFALIAIYGKTYCVAASDAWDLLTMCGIDAVVNDNLIGSVLFFGSLFSGLASGLAAILVGASILPSLSLLGLFFIGFVIGLVLASCVLEVIASAVAAFFVCLSEDVQKLRENHTELHDRLMPEMNRLYQLRFRHQRSYQQQP